MKGILQIMLGTLLAIWRFATPGHGFWKNQTRYHSYEPDPTVWVDTLTVVIYLACSLLIGFGIYRVLSAKSDWAQRTS